MAQLYLTLADYDIYRDEQSNIQHEWIEAIAAEDAVEKIIREEREEVNFIECCDEEHRVRATHLVASIWVIVIREYSGNVKYVYEFHKEGDRYAGNQL